MQTGATQVPNRTQAIKKNCKTSAKKNLHLCAWQEFRLQKARPRSTSFQRGRCQPKTDFLTTAGCAPIRLWQKPGPDPESPSSCRRGRWSAERRVPNPV